MDRSALLVGVSASAPLITSSAGDGCILQGDDVSLSCEVVYNGSSLMPLQLEWEIWTWHWDQHHEISNNTANASSVYRTSYSFTASGEITDAYMCVISFSSPTGLALLGVERQYSNRPSNRFPSRPIAPKTVASKTGAFPMCEVSSSQNIPF